MTVFSATQVRPRKFQRKALGQHFLVDGGILNRIAGAAGLTGDDVVVEIGPGRGALTRRLVERAGRVIALELDPLLAEALPDRLGNPANLEVVTADARTVDIGALLEGVSGCKVVANLPYYAANPILRRFLEAPLQPSLLVVMLQREVARSVTAAPGEMGLLSVAVQCYAEAKMVCTAPPRAFRPPPKVSSAVVRLDVRPQPAVPPGEADGFFSVVRAGFAAPRKQLRNSLAQGLRAAAEAVDCTLDAAGISGQRRPGTLTVQEWVGVYRAWEQRFAGASTSLRQD